MFRRDTVSEAKRIDPMLQEGEPFVTLTEDRKNVVGLKIGTGMNKWSELSYVGEERAIQLNERITALQESIESMVTRFAIVVATASIVLWLATVYK
jgi:hypothetical protein